MIFKATAHVSRQRKVCTESFVNISHHVSISLSIELLFSRVATFRRTCIQFKCRSMKFTFFGGMSLIQTHTSGNIQPVENIILYSTVKHITVFLGREHLTVDNPIGIFKGESLITIFPVLGRETTFFVVTLEYFHILEILATGKQIKREQRVEVTSA